METYSEMMLTDMRKLKGFDDFEVLKATILKEWEAKDALKKQKKSRDMGNK